MITDLTEFNSHALWTASERATMLRHEVGRDIVSAAYLRGDFIMNSGERSSSRFDPYLFLGKPTILRRLAELIAEQVPTGIDRLAGTSGPGISLVSAVSLVSGIPFAVVPASSATRAKEETLPVGGELHTDERIFLIEDVVDTATQALASAGRITQAAAHVTRILSVIDRENGGAERLAAAKHDYAPLFRLSELAT